MHIRTAEPADAALLAQLVRRSFATVARDFGLTPDNCPKHPSNCTQQWVEEALAQGVEYFVLVAEGGPVGCAALERAGEDAGYLGRLAVLPAHRCRGYGRALVEHVLARARRLGLVRVELAMIAADARLRAWYEGLGFRATGTRTFEHLPFMVLFMARDVGAAPPPA